MATPRTGRAVAVVALVAALAAGCAGAAGGATSPDPDPDPGAPTAGPGTGTGTSTGSSTSPGIGTGTRQPCDPAGLPDGLGCAVFASVSGTTTDDGVDLSWLAAGTMTVDAEHTGGSAYLGVGTPCNTLTVPVSIDGTTLHPDRDRIATTLMGCLDEEVQREESWVVGFVSGPMAFSLDGPLLTLETPDATVVLRRR